MNVQRVLERAVADELADGGYVGDIREGIGFFIKEMVEQGVIDEQFVLGLFGGVDLFAKRSKS